MSLAAFRLGMSHCPSCHCSLNTPSPVLVRTALTSPMLYLQVRHREEEIHVMLENLFKELLPVP